MDGNSGLFFLGGTGQIQRPEIEFLATNQFEITQTGSRILNGLQISWQGSPGTFNSGEKKSDLFGEVYKGAIFSSLYIDVSDDSLSFTGTSTTLGAFTMGAYFLVSGFNNIALFIMVPHQAQFTSDLFGDTTKWRLAFFLQQFTGDQASLTYSTETAASNYNNFLFTIPSEMRSGFVHLAHTYDPNQSGGTLKSYVNGVLSLTRTSLAMKVYGSQGAYVKFFHNQHRFLIIQYAIL